MCGRPCPNKLDGSLSPQSGSCLRARRFGQARFFQLLGTACIFRRHRISIGTRSSAWLTLSSERLQPSNGHHHRVHGFGIRRQLCIRNRRGCPDTIRHSALGTRNVDARAVRLQHVSNEQGSRQEKCRAAQRSAAHSSSSDTIKSGAFDQPERGRRESMVYWLAPWPTPAFFCAFCRSVG